MADDYWGQWAESLWRLRTGDLVGASQALSESIDLTETPPPMLSKLRAQLDAWLNPPTTPEPARPFGALRRWVAGDDSAAAVLQASTGLPHSLYVAVTESIRSGQPVPVHYQGLDSLNQLLATISSALIRLVMTGAVDDLQIGDADVLLQWGVGCPALERIHLALSAPDKADNLTELIAGLRDTAMRSGDTFGAETLSIIEALRTDHDRRDQALGATSFRRLVDLPRAGPAPSSRSATAEPSEFYIQVLGGFRLGEFDDEAINHRLRPQQAAVLQALALHAGRWLHRNNLVDWFWPDVEFTTGLRRLATALSAVRSKVVIELDGVELVRRKDSYRLVTDQTMDGAAMIALLRRVESEAGLQLAESVRHLSEALTLGERPLLPDHPTADWTIEARWELQDRWQRAVLAIFRRLDALPIDESLADGLVQLFPRILTIVDTNDAIWRRCIEFAQDSGAPLMAAQLEARYDNLVLRLDQPPT
jgi:DNA-binding SARP family transcriptional activator